MNKDIEPGTAHTGKEAKLTSEVLDEMYEIYLQTAAQKLGADISTPEARDKFVTALALTEILNAK